MKRGVDVVLESEKNVNDVHNNEVKSDPLIYQDHPKSHLKSGNSKKQVSERR